MVLLGLVSGIGIWSYALSLFISGIIQRNICRSYFEKKTNADGSLEIDFSLLKSLWPMSWRLWILLLSMYIFQKCNTIVSSKALGLDETAGFGLVFSLFSIASQITRTPLVTKYPEISRLWVSGCISQIRKIFFSRLIISMVLLAICLAVTVFLGPIIIKLIGSKTNLPNTTILLITAIFYLFDKHQDEYLTLVLSKNKNPFIIPYILTAVISLLFMSIGATYYGLIGLVLGQGLSQMLINNWWVVWRGLQELQTS